MDSSEFDNPELETAEEELRREGDEAEPLFDYHFDPIFRVWRADDPAWDTFLRARPGAMSKKSRAGQLAYATVFGLPFLVGAVAWLIQRVY